MNLLDLLLVVSTVFFSFSFFSSVLYFFFKKSDKKRKVKRERNFIFCYIAFSFSLFNVAESDAQWKVLGTAGFSAGAATNTAIAISGSEIPYVAFQDGANAGKATVMKYNGSLWKIVGTAGFSAGTATFSTTTTPIAIDKNGVPYVAFSDGGNSGKATVMKYSGGSWLTVGSAGFSAGSTTFVTIALNSTGTPYVAYNDAGNSNKVTVMTYNGSSWVVVGSAGISAGTSKYTSIAINSSNVPYVAYRDGSNSNKATVMKYNGTNWALVGTAGFTANISYNPSLAIDGLGNLFLAYQDGSFGPATVKQFTGTSWATYGVADFSAGKTQYTTLALDKSGIPYVAYQDVPNDSSSTVMTYDGEIGWTPFGSTSFSAGTVYTNSIAIGPSNSVYVAYRDKVNSNKATVMRYAEGNVLGLKLTSFELSNLNNYINLKWGTSTENNLSSFTIERANDSLHFDSIGNVVAIGYDITAHTYSFNDMAPLNEPSYYRLKEIPADGNYYYSIIKSITPEMKNNGAIFYPNPAHNNFTISIYNAEKEQGTLKLINLSGQEVYSTKVFLTQGDNRVNVAIPDESQGIYTAELKTDSRVVSQIIVLRK